MNIFIPLLPLGFTVVLAMIFEIASPKVFNKRWLLWLQALGCAAGLILFLLARPTEIPFFKEILSLNHLSALFEILFLSLGVLIFILSEQYLSRMRLTTSGELPVLLGIIFLALNLLTFSNDLILSWVLFELVSITLYFCVGFFKNEPASREVALKYFALGVFASAFLTLGIALLYPFTGSFSLSVIGELFAANTTLPPTLGLAVFLISTALLFKLAIVPLHLWVPDVYTGTITPLTALMATSIKAMALYLLLTIVFVALKPISILWDTMWQSLVFFTLLGGSVLALTQTDFKRLMAYSSIVNAGYLFLGCLSFDAGNVHSWAALAFFLLSYTVATVMIFYCLAILEMDSGTAISGYRGLWQRSPFLAIAITVGLLSLTGFPFLAGFMAKVYLFVQAAAAGKTILVFCGLGVTVISIYYYLLPVLEIFFKEPEFHTPVSKPGVLANSIIFILTLFLLTAGLAAAPVINWISQWF